jgi:hypothetical protein
MKTLHHQTVLFRASAIHPKRGAGRFTEETRAMPVSWNFLKNFE